MSGEVEIRVALDEKAAKTAIDSADARARSSKDEADQLRGRPGRAARGAARGPRGRPAPSGEAAFLTAIVVGVVATIVAETITEAIDDLLEEYGVAEWARKLAEIRERAKRWGLPIP